MSELLKLIDAYKGGNGQPSDASVARAAGIQRQRISLWRNKGVTAMPDPDTLAGLAQFLKLPLETVVMAAARDAGYLRPKESGSGGLDTPAMNDDVG